MDSSRIFIRGLPPTLSEADFRKHFSAFAELTDAKFLPRRRIGYVGYKSHVEAQKAVKYFNKSYIRMSRIGVELARPVEEQAMLKPSVNLSITDNHTHLNDGRKYENLPAQPVNPKLQEFLEVMQPPSKSKTWANEEFRRSALDSEPIVEKTKVDVADDQSDEEYQHVSKRRKISPTREEVASKKDTEMTAKELIHASKETAIVEEAATLDSQAQVDPVSVPVPVVTPASDADWLRSRTSRLLGLADDDDDALMASSLNQTEAKDTGSGHTVDETFDLKPVSDLITKTDEKQHEEVSDETKESVQSMEETDNTGRLFVRNLSYTTKEVDLREYFSKFGDLEEVHVPVDPRSNKTKGFAYVQFISPQAASLALSELDGKSFQGRLLHILPASAKKDNTLDEYAISQLPIKKQKEIRRKAEASTTSFKWNSMYMNTNAIISSISDRLGIPKSELLDPTSSSSAVKQAHAETNIIQETKRYFANNGVDLEAFKKNERGDTAILIKNFSYGTGLDELKKLLEPHGTITKLLMPPTGTIAIVEFEHASQAKSAFGALAYRKLGDSIIFLEKAPKGLFDSTAILASKKPSMVGDVVKTSATDLLESTISETAVNTSTLFVRNLNFCTSTERLSDVFKPLDGFISARVKTKSDPKKPGEILSMGFGFLEFRSSQQAQAALGAMNGYKLDGYALLIKASHKGLDMVEERRKKDQEKKVPGERTKVIIKNLPFESSKEDVRSLFESYGQLRSVRVPKKFDNTTRGFAFANFVTAREAQSAIEALRDTHLLGRRLVMEFASEDIVDPEEEIEKMQKKVGRQADKVALQKLTGVSRKKFSLEGEDENDGDY